MKIDDLIAILQRAREAAGNIDVNVTSFCGTNQAHVVFDIDPPKRKDFSVKNHMNDLGQFCLHVNISQHTRTEIAEGVADMKSKGWRFFRSQFIESCQTPSEGLSPCEWHNPW